MTDNDADGIDILGGDAPAQLSDKWSRRARIAVLGGLAAAAWVPFGALGYACSRMIG